MFLKKYGRLLKMLNQKESFSTRISRVDLVPNNKKGEYIMSKPVSKKEMWLYTVSNKNSRRKVKRAISKARRQKLKDEMFNEFERN